MADNIDFHELDQEAFEAADQLADHEEVKAVPSTALKKPATAFSLFIQEVRPLLKEDMTAQGVKSTMFLTEASKRWNAMPAEAKQKYFEMAQKHKDQYVKA